MIFAPKHLSFASEVFSCLLLFSISHCRRTPPLLFLRLLLSTFQLLICRFLSSCFWLRPIFLEVGSSGLLVAGFVLLTLCRCLAARVARRELRPLALLSYLLVSVVLVPLCLSTPRLLPLAGIALHRLLCLLHCLVVLRLHPCLRPVLSFLPPVAPLTWCRLSS